MGQPDLAESAWRRGLSDASRSMRSLSFWALDGMFSLIIAGVAGVLTATRTDDSVIQNSVPPSVGVAWLAFIILAFIGWNVARAPYRQRDEARRLLGPPVSLQAEFPKYFDLRDNLKVLVVPGISVVNRADRRMDIDLRLHVELKRNAPARTVRLDANDKALPNEVQNEMSHYRGSLLTPPLPLEPQHQVAGYAAFFAEGALLDLLGDEMENAIQWHLAVFDVVSNRDVARRKLIRMYPISGLLDLLPGSEVSKSPG